MHRDDLVDAYFTFKEKEITISLQRSQKDEKRDQRERPRGLQRDSRRRPEQIAVKFSLFEGYLGRLNRTGALHRRAAWRRIDENSPTINS